MVEVVWRKGAYNHLEKQCNHIKKDSPKSAEKVKNTILDIAESLKNSPKIYPLDKYRKNNKGNIRAFEKYSLRVAYQVTEKQIRIIRVRHTSREPLKYY
ncbi:type II toxin-antitoxin system RelE/ParE family toxin [Aquimarina agarivorans]|uniref:type II toxin-antitoxin system RelE/ParE family toxin n=1 Tax=Aquimarina agarivorans TaxID=980584 RepID=UPI000248F5AA|nr:type II toxin-antitoxin system RelE/ParE family toxin [Aquimarina agarivorans]